MCARTATGLSPFPPADCLSCSVGTNLCVSFAAMRIPRALHAGNLLCQHNQEEAMPCQRILIVDNDEDVLISLERALEENSYDTVTTWGIPDDLEMMASTGEFDLLLIGDHPPDLNCERVLKMLRQRDIRLPVVVMHSTARHPFSEQYLRYLGAGGVACKWSDNEVVEAVRACLEPPGAGASKPKAMRAAAGM